MSSENRPGIQVIELRAVVQRVEEGPAVRVHPHAFKVRRVSGLRALLNDHSGGGSRSSGAAIVTTTTGFFPPVSQGEDRFSPKFTINRGAAESTTSSSAVGLLMNGGGGGAGAGVRSSWSGTAAAAASPAAEATPPLALYEYAAVDFFIEAAGCPTEADFLRLEACVDVAVSGAAASATGATPIVGSVGVPLLSLGLTERNPPRPAAAVAAAVGGLRAMGVGIGQPIKRWF